MVLGLERRGGNRHSAKPHVDEGLLMQVFSLHLSLLQHMGIYETTSTNQAVNPKGLFKLLPLIKGLVQL